MATDTSAASTFLSDAEAEIDALEFTPYVQGLANLLGDPRTEAPLTLGVLGGWGTGKTSLLKQIRRALQEGPPQFDGRSDNRTLWVNVWELSLQGDLTRSFLQTVLTECRRQLPPHRRLQFDWYLLRSRLDRGAVVRQLVQNSYRVVLAVAPLLLAQWQPSTIAAVPFDSAAGLASLVLATWLVLKPLLEVARDKVSLNLDTLLQKQPYELQVSVLRRLRDDFDRLVRTWIGKRGRLVVFVDDLDRCPPDVVPGLLEAIKLFLAIDRCIYVLALDEEVIASSIQLRYGGSSQSGGRVFDGKRYLEKIVQLPFLLPAIEPSQIEHYIASFAPPWPRGDARCAVVFARGLQPNPRQIKRAVNVFLLLTGFLQQRRGIGEWVTPVRLAKIVALQTGYGAVFDRLKHDPGLIKRLEAASLQDDDADAAPPVDGVAVPDDLRQQPYFFELFRLFREDESARFADLTDEQLAAFFSLAGRVSSSAAPSRAPDDALKELIEQYHTIRSTQAAGPARTRAMTGVATEMVALAASLGDFNVTGALASKAPGWRLAGYAFLYARPDSGRLVDLISTLEQLEDQPFGQWWALQAIDASIRQAHTRGVGIDRQLVGRLYGLADRVKSVRDTSRYNLLIRILSTVQTTSAGS